MSAVSMQREKQLLASFSMRLLLFYCAEAMMAAAITRSARIIQRLQHIDDLETISPTRRSTTVVWISAFPRSGSSTVLSMMRAASAVPVGDDVVGDRSAGGSDSSEEVFTLFEPCHVGKDAAHSDVLSSEMDAKHCPAFLSQVARCNFSAAESLWGWDDKHTTNHGKGYSAATAASYCSRASLLAFKTVGQSKAVDNTRRLATVLWVLKEAPDLHFLDIVRDPRAIYASWKTTDPFARILQERSDALWREACDTFADNLDVNHPRVHRVVMEDLAQDPNTSMKDVYGFLGLSFGTPQKRWLDEIFFSGNGCHRENDYTDCHTKPSESLTKWRDELTSQELSAINEYEPCIKVMRAYGYPLT